ncbi:hypothetical protein APHAL10511_003828 [Amanita phalloides]|nr:hypothetical protein APHAL10511_003828 [Amanita phalloides]
MRETRLPGLVCPATPLQLPDMHATSFVQQLVYPLMGNDRECDHPLTAKLQTKRGNCCHSLVARKEPITKLGIGGSPSETELQVSEVPRLREEVQILGQELEQQNSRLQIQIFEVEKLKSKAKWRPRVAKLMSQHSVLRDRIQRLEVPETNHETNHETHPGTYDGLWLEIRNCKSAMQELDDRIKKLARELRPRRQR